VEFFIEQEISKRSMAEKNDPSKY